MAPVSDLWRRQGARLAYEVPLYQRFVDIVAVHDCTEFADVSEVVAIELKISNWRTALRQAAVAQLVADKAYIALSSAHIRAVDMSLLEASGIGLISVDREHAKIIWCARLSEIVVREYRDAIAAWVKYPKQTYVQSREG